MDTAIRKRYKEIGATVKTKDGKVVSLLNKYNGLTYKLGDYVKMFNDEDFGPIERFSYENGKVLAWNGNKFLSVVYYGQKKIVKTYPA
jgi:hypothetical protein